MSPSSKATSSRAIVEDVLGRHMTREIWTANFDKVLPLSVQDFDLSAVLPAVFYMFRFGQRRGKGNFLKTFDSGKGSLKMRRRDATIDRIGKKLSEKSRFEGFRGETEQAILGDLLLCFCLENTKRALGRNEQVQRVAPAHYMSSWIDLPQRVSNLRYVPEMIVAMLANQKGDYIQQTNEGDQTWFSVGGGYEDNVLLKPFQQGVVRRGELGSRTSDRFKEGEPVGLDQLLMIRLAQLMKSAPDKSRGSPGELISNQRPIAETAAKNFSEDIRRFVRSYADSIPRYAFVELLECCMAVGLTAILTSSIELLLDWADTGEIRKKCDQEPAFLFTDCSNGVNRRLRAIAEQSMDDFMRRVQRFPIILMVLRLLDWGARYDRRIKALNIPTKPCATEWVNVLGDLLYERREEAQAILYDLDHKSETLAERLVDDYPEAAHTLRNIESQANPVWRMAESIVSLQGRNNTLRKLINLIDSAMLVARPNGMALKRTATRKIAGEGTRKRSEIRSLVLTDAVLDYLVHLHVLPSGSRRRIRVLSFKDFISILHMRYGFCIDVAPPGMTISNELLQENRAILERRLRDLGLFVGVNDAEAMKRLQPRFSLALEKKNGLD